MKQEEYPILEFDRSRRALIEPSEQLERIPGVGRCVLTFFQEVIDRLRDEGRLRRIACLGSEMGDHPVWALDGHRHPIGVFHPAITSAFASSFLDELIALGFTTFVACGGAGVLRGDIAPGTVVVPTAAVRDEGASYHYLPPAREVEPTPEALAVIEETLAAHGVRYLRGKTWTTDGIYRETPEKIALRRSEGCPTVEMEAAGFFAVARFRGALFGQILYAGDDVSGDVWDRRGWDGRKETREELFAIATEACLALGEGGDSSGGTP